MAPRQFSERSLLDDFSEREVVRKFQLAKKLILMLYMRLQMYPETTAQRSHAISGMTILLAVVDQLVAGTVVGISQASFSQILGWLLEGYREIPTSLHICMLSAV